MRVIWAFLFLLGSFSVVNSAESKPNILFISVDDLNDWIGCLGGHPQAKTPNMDRLAASGVLFTNAHCPAPACNPSRSAVMTGIAPHVSGLYKNGQKMREVLPDAVLLPNYFRQHGYWAAGSGKMLHYFIDAQSWDEYYPAKELENPFSSHLDWGERPKSLPVGGPWQYRETDWHAFDVTDEEFGGDVNTADYISKQLAKQHDQPFFLACGIYRPHEPWFNPKHYFDQFPLESIQLPPGYKQDDLDDLPEMGKRLGPNRYFKHIQSNNQWKQAIQGYLASISFADANIGRVLDALENGPNKDNTIVVLWSDHGWHLGEKQHWQKFTAWRACTRVPLMIRVPKGTSGLPEGTTAGDICNKPVDLLSLYPTLTSLAGLPEDEKCDGHNLIPLLQNADADWDHPAITHLEFPGSFGLSLENWRYIKYHNGDEELYHIAEDPYEWTNLASNPAHKEKLVMMREAAPQKFAEIVPPSDRSLPKLTLIKGDKYPPSKPDGGEFEVIFANDSDYTIDLFWSNSEGALKSYGEIPAAKKLKVQTRPGSVWVVQSHLNKPIGYFRVNDRKAIGVVPYGSVNRFPDHFTPLKPIAKDIQLKSIDSEKKVTVIVRNNRPQDYTVHWVDECGKRADLDIIQGGSFLEVDSYTGHVFVLTDHKGVDFGYFEVGNQPTVFDIPAIEIENTEAELPAAQRSITKPPAQLELDSFYHKVINVNGYLVCSSEKVNDYALREAAYLVELMLAKRPDILKALADGGSRMTIMAPAEFTTDVPEHSTVHIDRSQSADWWDRRARGLGGSMSVPVASCGEENLLCFEGDPYYQENILIHEFAHTIHLRGLNRIDPDFDRRLRNIWKQAMDEGLWKDKYPSTAYTEYFAEGVQSWFNNNRENDHDHNHVNTRPELKEYDPRLATMLEEIFGDTELVYIKPRDRKQQAHMEGYDYDSAPSFKWPKRLRIIDKTDLRTR